MGPRLWHLFASASRLARAGRARCLADSDEALSELQRWRWPQLAEYYRMINRASLALNVPPPPPPPPRFL